MASDERGLVAYILKRVKAAYPRSWRFNVVGSPYQMRGVPDLLFCIDGVFIGAEVKFQRPGESEQHARDRTTATQKAQMQKIRKAGGYADTVLSADETLALIEHALTDHAQTG